MLMREPWLDPGLLGEALLAAHAVGIYGAAQSEPHRVAPPPGEPLAKMADPAAVVTPAMPAGFTPTDPLVARVFYRDALSSFLKKKVIGGHEFQAILDALPAAGSLLGDSRLRERAYSGAFTMVREAKDNMVKRVADKTADAIRNNLTPADFLHDVNDIYSRAGLRHQDPWYVNLVYQNATNRAFQEGLDRVAEEMDQDGDLWGYEWRHQPGVRNPRPAHVALDGFAAKADDERWRKIGRPPIGHGCHCSLVAVSVARARRERMRGAPATPKIKARGELYHGMDAIRGLDAIPGQRFEKSEFNIATRPLLNPSWKF